MSNRVALVDFPSADAADAALADVRKLDRKKNGIHDAAVVVRTAEGHIELHQTSQLAAGDGAVAGGSAGLVAGLLLGLPVAGAAVGLLGGGSWGLRDTGIPDERLRQLGRELEPGHAVLCVLVEEQGLAEVRDALAVYGEVLEAGVEPTAP
jgi:uncharacterized membrane protein